MMNPLDVFIFSGGIFKTVLRADTEKDYGSVLQGIITKKKLGRFKTFLKKG